MNPNPKPNPNPSPNPNASPHPNPHPNPNPHPHPNQVDRLLRRAPRLVGSSTASLAAALAALEAMVAELLPPRVCALDLVAAQPTLLGNDVPKRAAPI